MPESYFEKFPTVKYKGTECRDITRRVKINEETRNALTLYYTYDIKDGTRPDLIADAYYENPELDWMLWLSNYIVDPYYQWNLTVNEFEDYMRKKYGSIEYAIKKIACYRNNWYDDEEVLTPEFYDHHLEHGWRKYYQPFYGNGVHILYWQRRPEDWLMETNQIWKLTVHDPLEFYVGELVDVENETQVARRGGGEVTSVSNTYIMIKNIDGSFANNYIVTGEFSNIPEVITDVDLVYQAVANDEAVFWSPVTLYDIENERNAYNRTINILDKAQLPNTIGQLNELIRA